MTSLDVLNMIGQAGGSVGVEAGDLRILAPVGLLTAEHKAILTENKPVLLQLLAPEQADPEREAIQWVENLSPTEAAVVVGTARRQWAELVGADQHEDPVVLRAEIVGDELRLLRPTPELAAKVEAGRPYLEKVLAEIGAGAGREPEAVLDDWDQAVEPILCSICGEITACGNRACREIRIRTA